MGIFERFDILDFFFVINVILGAVSVLCYFYQFLYVLFAIFKKNRSVPEAESKNLSVLISARNESAVIANLIDSLKKQEYPQEKIKIFVVADNCTDNTAEICRSLGVNKVYERFNKEYVGKGYALDFLIKNIHNDGLDVDTDAYIVFDADNIVDKNFFREVNNVYSAGYEAVTSYRNSKNYGDNWISSGYALWYMRESKYLNVARYKINSSCAVSGTGFLFDKSLAVDEKGEPGWKYHLLTEDVEFSADIMCRGGKIGMAENAVTYDEQPTGFAVSFRQRMRWVRGYFQVMRHYGGRLLKGIFGKGIFACYDMAMNIAPSILFSIGGLAINVATLIVGPLAGLPFSRALISFGIYFAMMYGTLFAVGIITLITEWKRIYCSAIKKIVYLITFPVFIMSYIPVTVAAMFSKVTWKPIEHNISTSIDDLKNKEK